MVTAYRRLMVEIYGWISAKCLLRIAKHGAEVGDFKMFNTARTLLDVGVACGWDKNARGSKLTPGRDMKEFLRYGSSSEIPWEMQR